MWTSVVLLVTRGSVTEALDKMLKPDGVANVLHRPDLGVATLGPIMLKLPIGLCRSSLERTPVKVGLRTSAGFERATLVFGAGRKLWTEVLLVREITEVGTAVATLFTVTGGSAMPPVMTSVMVLVVRVPVVPIVKL